MRLDSLQCTADPRTMIHQNIDYDQMIELPEQREQ